MSANARCNLVVGIAVTAMVVIGALSADGAALFINKWVGVVEVAVIAFGSAPDFEMVILAVIMPVLACFAHALPLAFILLPGGVAGFMLLFRTGRLLEWL